MGTTTVQERSVARDLSLLVMGALKSAGSHSQHGFMPSHCSTLTSDEEWVRAMRRSCEELWWDCPALGETVRRFIDEMAPEFTLRARDQRREEFAAERREQREAA